MPLAFGRMLATGDLAVPITGETEVADRRLKRVMVYMGMPSQRLENIEYARAMRQRQHWTYGHDDEVTISHRSLKYPPGWTPASDERPREKGVDVMLAMDLVRGVTDASAECSFDLAILACADTDLIPAVEFVVDHKGADAIQTVAPQNKVDREGRRLGDGPLPIRAAQTTARRVTNRTITVAEGAFVRVSDRADHYQARSARIQAPMGRRLPPNRG